MKRECLTVYIDYKSPYAYLAIHPTYQLQLDFELDIDWLPYTLNIPDFLGSATVNSRGEVLEEERSAHQWRRVRYSYMDARRYATIRGLTIRGPQKIWDSTIVSVGLLYAKSQDKFEPYNDLVYEKFWKRELDIEDERVVTSILQQAGIDITTFGDFLSNTGRILHDKVRAEAEGKGVFGVPTYILDGQLYWGREHLPLIRELLTQKGLLRANASASNGIVTAGTQAM